MSSISTIRRKTLTHAMLRVQKNKAKERRENKKKKKKTRKDVRMVLCLMEKRGCLERSSKNREMNRKGNGKVTGRPRINCNLYVH